MKKLVLFFLIIIIYGCKPKEVVISNEQLKEVLDYLASDEIKGRDTGSEGIELSAQFLEKKFKNYGVKPYYETYRDDFKIDSIDAFNVVGIIEGKDNKLKNEVVLIGAHYDHIGFRTKKIENDSIANGANDNASGTAVVLALADYFSQRKNNKRSLVFALFSGEEMGLRGSRHLADKMKSDGVDIYTVVNFEMLGVPFTDRDYDAFISGYDLSNMAEKINEYLNTNVVGKSGISMQYNLFRRSDNYPFYEAYKIPSHTISSCDLTNYDFYHHPKDESDQMNYDHMANLVNKLAPAIEMMSNTPEKEIMMIEQPSNE